MSIGLRISYSQMFDEPRPDISSLFQYYSSRDVIASLAMINDKLVADGTGKKTQIELLRDISTDYQPKLRDEVFVRAVPLIMSGYVLFALPNTIELVNREFSNFRVLEEERTLPEYEDPSMLKAIIAVSDELTERDTFVGKDSIEAAKLGGENLTKLLWPHIIKQHEFLTEPNAIFECYKGMAFISYLERHAKFGDIGKSYFETLGSSCGSDYLHRIISLVIQYIKREKNENNYFFNIKVSSFEPVLEALVIDPNEIRNNPAKQLDYLGLKEKPIFKIGENHYIIPYWPYLLNALFTGLSFSFFKNSKVSGLFNINTKDLDGQTYDNNGLAQFKSIIGREFSENILFKNTMKACFNRKDETLTFFDDNEQFNPDCYYRKGNHIFIMEFKDYLLKSDVIQSDSYEKIKEEIDRKFVSYIKEANGKKKLKEKGVSQLARNIELLNSNQDLFWELDIKAFNQKLKLKNMNIYPVIVHTNIYFDIPGINDYLNDVIQRRLRSTIGTFRAIKPFTMVNFQYFFDRLLLFADSILELNEEFEYYHNKINSLKLKTQKTFSDNDWLKSLEPFSSVSSEKFKKHFEYRRDDLLDEIRNCWLIDN